MNIFATSNCPIQSAKWLPDKLIVKMVTETAQCLACAVIRYNVPQDLLPLTKSGKPVKGGYHNHPCSIWCGNNKSNFKWAVEHGLAIAEEYTARYGKIHFSEGTIKQLAQLIGFIPDGKLEEFPVAISEDKICRKVINNFDNISVPNKYKLYIKHDKFYATWRRNKPGWINNNDLEIAKM